MFINQVMAIKHLRSKLFLSVGVVLLIVALLNYILPEIFVRSELKKVGSSLEKHLDKIQKRINDFSAFLIKYQIVEGAAELAGLSRMVTTEIASQSAHKEEISPLMKAIKIATYNPQVAFVQLTDASGTSVTVAPGDATLYTPLFAPFQDGMLWVKLPEKQKLFIAISEESQNQAVKSYLLFDVSTLKKESIQNELSEKLALAAKHVAQSQDASYTAFEKSAVSIQIEDSTKELYAALVFNENQWLEKIDLIQKLASSMQKMPSLPFAGILKADLSLKQGVCVLQEEAFLKTPQISDISTKISSEQPFLILRDQQTLKDLDLTTVIGHFEQGAQTTFIGIGFSISSMIKKIAKITQKQVLCQSPSFSLGFKPDGEVFETHSISLPSSNEKGAMISLGGENYLPYVVNLQLMNMILLVPEKQATAISRFLDHARQGISAKVSFTLLAAALASLLIALLLLGRVSKKITEPITLLSKAAEELGKGKYEGLILPNLEHCQDEVAVLTHSFENMVGALRDRDKIRGVLNKVVSKEISEEILKHNIELGGEERVLTMLFSDIRSFTHLSEHLKPQVLIGMLNSYMTQMCRIIDEMHGVVDKFVGDEIMALYGAPLPMQSHAIKAIESALLMIEHLREYNKVCVLEGKIPFESGIGIHTGLVCVGNMGAENRLNYTVIGASVNLASRLCSQAEPMQILVSEETYNAPGVKAQFQFQALPPLSLKGIDHPVQAYIVLGRHP